VGDVYPHLDQRWVGVVTAVAVAGLAIRSASLAIRSQYIVMAVIALSLLSFFLGGPVEESQLDLTGTAPRPDRWASGWPSPSSSPAVTGIEAGVNMSGDLKDSGSLHPPGHPGRPGRGLPGLHDHALLLQHVGRQRHPGGGPPHHAADGLLGPLILLGAMGATLSSAMGSILGAPRVLQAMARDGVLPAPPFLGKGSGEDDAPGSDGGDPGVALVAIFFGDLNMVAPILTMFFLTSYMTVNFAAGVEGFLQSPSFRPAFRVHWAISMPGRWRVSSSCS
jgi:solute carrier family 12 (sodium/potassium/chloride transporter), member 2